MNIIVPRRHNGNRVLAGTLFRIFTAGLTVWLLWPASLLYGVPRFYAGARAAGMGNAFSTLAYETSALYWNPAGLGDLKGPEISGMYSADALGTGYTFASYGQPLPAWGGVGFGWLRFANEFEKTDAGENVLGTAGVSTDLFLLGASYYRDLPVSFGITAKVLQERIDRFSLGGWALDAGMLYEREPFRFALVIEHALSGGLSGDSVNGGTVTEPLPPTFRGGISFFSRGRFAAGAGGAQGRKDEPIDIKMNAALDFSARGSDPGAVAVSPGLEFWLNGGLGLRAGIRELRDYTAGVSLKAGGIRFDYGFIMSGHLENSHIFSTSFFF